MTDVPQWCWAVMAALVVVLVLMLAVSAANATARRRAPRGEVPPRQQGWRRVGDPWWPAAISAFLVLMAAVLLVAPRVSGGYSSTALVSLGPRDPAATSADTLLLLGPRYLTLLENPTVLRTAATAARTTEEALRDGSKATVQASTLIVDIKFNSDDAATAARNAQALATALLDSVAQDPLVKGRLIGSAVVPESPATPTLVQTLVVGALVAVGGALVLGLAVRRRVIA